MVRENGDSAQDGADEKMLGSSDKEALALKNIDVKFISGENANGDAKIEIGNVEKAFTGMTKEELMKYANDPFWIKLRWILFIAFWGLWIAMLAGAIAIILFAPKCAAPTPLAWYEKGPMCNIQNTDDIEKIKSLNVQAVIFELPAEETYLVEQQEEIQNKIKGIVEKFNEKEIKVVLDLTPNYVTVNDELFKQATVAEPNADVLGAFVTTSSQELNWKKVGTNQDAFVKHGKHTFLSQFGNNIDLRMDNELVQEKFKNVLTKLVELGVKGFRLMNAKHLLIANELQKEPPKADQGQGNKYAVGEYNFYMHEQTTYRDGLGDLLQKFTKHVHNITDNEGFLSIHDPLGPKPAVFKISGTQNFGFDLPKIDLIGLIGQQSTSSSSIATKMFNYFRDFNETSRPFTTSWMQWQFNKEAYNHLEPSALYMFISFLRGVQIAPLDAFEGIDAAKVKDLADKRELTALQHGSFDFFLSQNSDSFAYARIKSGNPGYFVALNPSMESIKANFTTTDVIASEMEVFMLSKNFNNTKTKAKYSADDIDMPPQSTAIFTFVPK